MVKLLKDLPSKLVDRAIDKLNELRMQHPGHTDWDLLLYALALEYEKQEDAALEHKFNDF